MLGRLWLAVVALIASAAAGTAWAATAALPDAGKEFQDCAECPTMVVVPPGSFTMGTPQGWTTLPGNHPYGQPDELPEHKVTIGYKFAVGKYLVTKGEYAKFANETKRLHGSTCRAPNGLDENKRMVFQQVVKDRDWRNPGFPQTDKDPVICVLWKDARDYAQWISQKSGKTYRLLSEAEFEYASKAGTNTLWYWGNDPNRSCEYSNLADLSAQAQVPGWKEVPQCKDGYVYTSPVGSFKPNAFGLYDMVGNVMEWNQDCTSADYKGAPVDGSPWMTGGDCDSRIFRGGTFTCTLTCDPSSVPPNQVNNVQSAAVGRAANRDRGGWGDRYSYVGFRLARSE